MLHPFYGSGSHSWGPRVLHHLNLEDLSVQHPPDSGSRTSRVVCHIKSEYGTWQQLKFTHLTQTFRACIIHIHGTLSPSHLPATGGEH